METKRDFYQTSLTAKSAGAAFDDLNDDRVAPRSFLVVTHVSVENETTAYTNLRVGVDQRGSIRFHEEEKNPAADEIYWTRSRFFVPEGAYLKVRCVGCTASDILKVNIQGYLYTYVK